MIEAQMATLMAQQRLGRSAAEAYFLDADMYRKGTVPASKFKRALRLMFQDIPFTEDMLNALCMARVMACGACDGVCGR